MPTADPAAVAAIDPATEATETLDPNGVEKGKPVPYGRFAAAINEKNTANAAAAEAKRIAEAQTQRVATIERERDTAREDAALARGGFADPEAVDLLRILHGRLPEQDRPTLVDYAAKLRADPAAAPRSIAWALGSPAASTQTTTTQTATATTTTARPAASTSATTAASEVDDSQMRALSARMLRGGMDAVAARAEYEALEKARRR